MPVPNEYAVSHGIAVSSDEFFILTPSTHLIYISCPELSVIVHESRVVRALFILDGLAVNEVTLGVLACANKVGTQIKAVTSKNNEDFLLYIYNIIPLIAHFLFLL